MDINDIGFRLKRAYKTVDKRFEPDIDSNLNVKSSKKGRQGKIEFTFGKHDTAELHNIVFNIISAIAGLKDHLKNKLQSLEKNHQIVEDTIDNCFELQLIIDLWNQEKHGYPLKRETRSNKDPKVVKLKQALTIKDPSKGSGSITFSAFSPAKQTTKSVADSDNVIVVVSGNVVDKNGNRLISLNEMINKSLAEFENLINENCLVN